MAIIVDNDHLINLMMSKTEGVIELAANMDNFSAMHSREHLKLAICAGMLDAYSLGRNAVLNEQSEKRKI